MKNKSSPLLLYGISILLVLIISFGTSIALYAIYLRLDYSFDIGPKFSQFDDTIGWTLKANASSFIKGSSPLRGITYFDSKVYTESNGFRSNVEKKSAATGAILAIGDSWTFGYCADYEDTYPYFLQKELNEPVVNMGVPAYGSGSVYALLERHVANLKPKVVIYFTIGLWSRSTGAGSADEILAKKKSILAPYFLHNFDTKETELAYPIPGLVRKSVKDGIYPGGSLTAGYNLWNYLWHVKLNQVGTSVVKKLADFFDTKLVRTKKKEQGTSDYDALPYIMKYELNQYMALAEKHNFQFVLLEGPHGRSYSRIIKDLNLINKNKIIYIGPDDFNREVYEKAEALGLSEEAKRIPRDGHFAYGTNKLIAELVAKKIREDSPSLLQ